MKKQIARLGIVMMLIAALSGCGGGTKNPSGSDSQHGAGSQAGDVKDGALSFSHASGFYDKAFSLEITCKDDKAVIYYTTDGSVPNEKDKRYEEPIKLTDRKKELNILSAKKGVCAGGDFVPSDKVDKANVIRAVAVYPDGKRSDVINGTFFVGMDREKKYGKVPVLSLLTDPKNLFDYDTGIYVLGKTYKDWLAEDKAHASYPTWVHVGNYSNRGKEWERPVTVEYFAPDGTSAFVQDLGIRIMGGASRDAVQKSFRITAREEYGSKSVKYELIPDNLRADQTGNVEKYKSFLLRNGGNDRDSAKIRDALMQTLAADRRIETQQYTPCVVYLDGEYWGWYLLNEDYSDHYIENNYGIDNKNVIVVKRAELEDGEEGDIALFNEMYDFITQNDMSIADNYQKAAGMLDMGSFADFCALQLYVFNEDSIFENNNWEMWRVRKTDKKNALADGKWRMMTYDLDYSCGVYAGGNTFQTNNIAEVIQGKRKPSVFGDEHERTGGELFASLYKSDAFRQELVLAMCDLRNLNFEKKSAVSALKAAAKPCEKLAPDQQKRFGPEWAGWWGSDDYYSQKINEIASFLNGRYDAFPRLLQGAMGLKGKAQCSVIIGGSEKGSVKLNSSGIAISGDFTGVYFPDYDITLTAVPEKGAKFVRWEAENCTVSDEKAKTVTVSFEGDFKVRAIFE